MQWVPSGQEYEAKRDPPTWGRPPLMMANPLKECYKWEEGYEKGGRILGEKHESSKERHIWGLRNPIWILEKGGRPYNHHLDWARVNRVKDSNLS